MELRWVSDLDRVADTRLRCYAATSGEQERYRAWIRDDPRAQGGDFLLAEQNGEAVGTTTSLSFTTWVRGAALSCQGVAWVGTIRTRRRGRSGIASQLMRETLRLARERGQVLSALMPFRASFYEHFGYGIVERRTAWTLPLAVLPTGPAEGFRFAEPSDRASISAGYQQFVESGQCGIERSAARWDYLFRESADGFIVIDRPDADGPVHGLLYYGQSKEDNLDYLKIFTSFADSPAAFRRQLHFLATLRDQYHAVVFPLPADLPMHWMLNESQIPHRDVNHPTAKTRLYTRMQMRVLDHRRLLEAMHWPPATRGEAVIAVHECEGHITRFRLRVESGRASVTPSYATPDLDITDKLWAALALGETPARQMVRHELISLNNVHVLPIIDALSQGPAPYCEEYF